MKVVVANEKFIWINKGKVTQPSTARVNNQFLLPPDPDTVGENQDQISDLISTMTGGDCEIQDIQPFMGDLPDSFQQLDLEALTRNPKTVTSEKRSRWFFTRDLPLAICEVRFCVFQDFKDDLFFNCGLYLLWTHWHISFKGRLFLKMANDYLLMTTL